jgi:hypothetical protein
MNQVLKSLTEITTGYSVFEKDQVLTHEQLNSVAKYFDDQTRLTRVKLLGVGIVCGLRVSVDGFNIKVTKGSGVTTDGDLLFFNGEMVFDQFKLYDDSNPAYGPFFNDGTLIKLYQLLPQGSEDERAMPLSQFAAETGNALNAMVAVLFMEAYVKDEDLCTGTDCDNLGQDFVNTSKLLLLDKASARLLNKTIPTPDQAAGALTEIAVTRPLVPSALSAPADLAKIYRAACNTIHTDLLLELAKLYSTCSSFLGDAFASDPTAEWTAKLEALKGTFTDADSGIQYYYDFLKDVCETCNHFREVLFGDATWCCPDSDSFPKHLLLGNLVPDSDPAANRTGFYPSPLASRTVDQLNHARFLAGKLNSLIQSYQTAAPAGAIRVTPSLFEDHRLEDRAIPCYYRTDTKIPIHENWSFRLHRQKMDAWNYSYNAAAYNAQGAAAKPLAAQVGRFQFFRIEGHIGQNVSTARTAIEKEIKDNNLPFFVESVLLGTDRTKVTKRPWTRYTDLHRIHQIVRKDLSYQLDDVKKFSTHYTAQIDTLTANDIDDLPQAKVVARQKDEAIATGVQAAKAALSQNYATYKSSPVWKTEVARTTTAAAEFKQNFGKVSKTEFATPIDSLISTTHPHWLDWLDILIKDKDDKSDEKLLFSKFQLEHPALEHFAGVLRGGTFVLVHDSDNNVVADFMLPYHCCEEPAEEPVEPDLPPPVRGDIVIKSGISIIPTLDKYVTSKLNLFTKDIIDPKINIQKESFDLFKGSFNTLLDVFSKVSVGTGIKTTGGVKFSDSMLDASVSETRAKEAKVQYFKEKALDTTNPPEVRERYTAQAKEAEAELARSIKTTVEYLSDSGAAVSTGSEGFNALLEVTTKMNTINDAGAKTTLREGLTDVHNKTVNVGMKTVLGGIIHL